MKTKLSWLLFFFFFFLWTACTPVPKNVKMLNELPEIYPDYTDITIPYNISPLNFLIRGQVQEMQVTVQGKTQSLKIRGSFKVSFPLKKWEKLLDNEKGNKLQVEVIVKKNNEWFSYSSFYWKIAPEAIDRYLSYRCIEPGYEVWNDLQIRERDIETFHDRVLVDNNLLENSCMNCHIYGGKQKEYSFFHLRGAKGGTILNRNGQLRKLALKNDSLPSAAVYGELHPSGRYGVFSSNIIIPGFHTFDSKRLEVYDTQSDLLIVDFDENKLLISPLTADKNRWETFPVFSAEGDWVYFCAAPVVELPDSIHQLKYSLCRIPFDTGTGKWGMQIDTLWNADLMKKSVCLPKASLDGKYLLYTVADFGTFPIWHRETDLQLMNLLTGEIDHLDAVNSNLSDTYHSWSSNSRWFVFASKRGDGMYGKPYFAYLDENGKVGKPFVLPQKDPEFYDYTLKSFNIPELSVRPSSFGAKDIEYLYKKVPSEVFE